MRSAAYPCRFDIGWLIKTLGEVLPQQLTIRICRMTKENEIGLAKALRPFDWRDRASDRHLNPSLDPRAHSPAIGCRADATRRFTPPEPINCAGGVKH